MEENKNTPRPAEMVKSTQKNALMKKQEVLKVKEVGLQTGESEGPQSTPE
jgi:hypothetical protein